jgi:membrane associated rhomboid family serine protease
VSDTGPIAGPSSVSQGVLAVQPETIPLRRGRGAVALHAAGFRHPGHLSREHFTPYADVTHLVAGARGLRIGTTRSVFVLPRSAFANPAAADRLHRALVERVAALSDGPLRLARFAELDQRARSGRPAVACWAFAAICVALYVVGRLTTPGTLELAGMFSRTLVLHGEPWRVLTGNLLHANALHLLLNLIVVVLIGALVERPLGAARTLFVIAAASVAAMGSGLVVGYEQALGASGVASGLVGAALHLELRHPAELPALWRLPRRVLVAAILLEAVVSFTAPFVAGAAHAAGFAAGYVAAALVARSGLRGEPAAPWLRVADAAVVAALALSLFLVVGEVAGRTGVVLRRAERLLEIPGTDPQLLNNTAWTLATEGKPGAEQLGVAERLAEEAVRRTHRQDPNVLDTLAEVLFQRGDADRAVATIDEAIALAPAVDYFREQRRRFTGERAANDRPTAPSEELAPGEGAEPPPGSEPPSPRPVPRSPDDDEIPSDDSTITI